MPTKRAVLDQLKRGELLEAVVRYEVKVPDRRARAGMVDALASSRKVKVAEILPALSRDRLKQLCKALELDDGGRTKAVLVERLTAKGRPARPARAKAASKKTASKKTAAKPKARRGRPPKGAAKVVSKAKAAAKKAAKKVAKKAKASRKLRKTDVIEHLTADELKQAVETFSLKVSTASKKKMVDALSRYRRAPLYEIVSDYSAKRLQELCAALGLDTKGRTRAVFIKRLTGRTAADAPQPAPKSSAKPAAKKPAARKKAAKAKRTRKAAAKAKPAAAEKAKPAAKKRKPAAKKAKAASKKAKAASKKAAPKKKAEPKKKAAKPRKASKPRAKKAAAAAAPVAAVAPVAENAPVAETVPAPADGATS